MNTFRPVWYCGITVIVISIILLAVNPRKAEKLPEGFYTPVVAFEFMQTESGTLDLFGHANTSGRNILINSMDKGTVIDFFYILSYTSFLILLSLSFFKETGHKWFILPMAVAIIVMYGDFMENSQLLAITSKLDTGNFSSELSMLHVYTWIKWFGLVVIFLCFIPALWSCGRYGRFISIIAFTAAAAGISAFCYTSLLNEVFVILIAMLFILLIIFSWFKYRSL